MAYVGCIAGAISLDEYRNGLAEAGFAQVDIIDTGSDLNAYAKVENQSGCCSPAMGTGVADGFGKFLLFAQPVQTMQTFTAAWPTCCNGTT